MAPATTTLDYDRASLRPGIVHIGVGAFHRAHQAVYADDLLRQGATDAGIRAVNLHPPALSATHSKQHGLYGVLTRDQFATQLRNVGSLLSVQDPGTSDLDALADEYVRLVTLTITEKGYCHIPGTTRLDDAQIDADLRQPDRPNTAIGFLAAALERRRAAGLGPIVIASCDNIPANGKLLRAVLFEFVARTRPALLGWFEANVSFPVSMVDRIVPRMDHEARMALEQATGAPDGMGVVAEPFRQWVLEADFSCDIPALDRVGVQYVRDVVPYEVMKHRILNGAQTALAHIGYLSGFATSFEAASDARLARYALDFMKAQARTLTCPPGENLEAYIQTSLLRLQNPHIRHPLAQIGTDSSFKIGQRVAEAACWHITHGGDADLYAFTLAAWMVYNLGIDSQGLPIPVDDPLKPFFEKIASRAGEDMSTAVPAILALDMFEGPVREDAAFRRRLVEFCSALKTARPSDLLGGMPDLTPAKRAAS